MSLIIVSNREPLQEENGHWQPSVGGLTTALLPVLEKRGGVWVAWGEEKADEVPSIQYPEDDPILEVKRLKLTDEEVGNYYYGLANRVLWPVCHYFIEQMDLQQEFFDDYAEVNRRFADAVAETYSEGDAVWIQDYHLLLAPGFVREQKPDARIGFFFHIPWPAVEVWRTLPWSKELTKGLLGADLLGFHNEAYAGNFLDAAKDVGATVEGNCVYYEGRTIRAEPHPIGIDTARFESFADKESVQKSAEELKASIHSEYIIVGVDRLDYTKGLPERLLAFEHFLEHNPDYQGKVTLYQVASPSRTRVESYQELKRTVDEIAGRINGAYMQGDWVPVRYLYRSFPQEELASVYLAADAALITPIRDGMNVVAQEFSLITQSGTLILSNLTGAADVLTETLRVNPFDIEEVSHAIKEALTTPEEKRKERAAKLREQVKSLDVHGWAEGFLNSLEGRGAS